MEAILQYTAALLYEIVNGGPDGCREAARAVGDDGVGAIIRNLHLPEGTGVEYLADQLRRLAPSPQFGIWSAEGDVDAHWQHHAIRMLWNPPALVVLALELGPGFETDLLAAGWHGWRRRGKPLSEQDLQLLAFATYMDLAPILRRLVPDYLQPAIAAALARSFGSEDQQLATAAAAEGVQAVWRADVEEAATWEDIRARLGNAQGLPDEDEAE